MKHVLKLFSLLVVISALWIGLLQASIIPRSHTWLVSFFLCFDVLLFMSNYCNAVSLNDIAEAKDFLKQKGVDVGSD
ncbi:hypothetical protein Godav_018203 [Gossypium davidsonii]|uniref:Dolichol-phosphate mannosyltransferase subunit 3 n=1 Tax=Gossypium davidsonii TaxID=34287 RepID=A0A7J8QVP5_GOSDV|nr:hypothetical protein [Gossypium davidsonii]